MRTLLVAFAVSLAACGEDTKPSAETRSDVVKATGSTGTKTTAPSTPGSSASATPARKGKLCASKVDKDAPKAKLQRSTSGSTSLTDADLETGGTWTWINVWAGWCGPCRAEIPVLRDFQTRLEKDGAPIRLTFVSVDDDIRETQKAMTTLKMSETLYAADGKERTNLLDSLGSSDRVELPIQALVDPKGRLRCVAHGEVNEQDYAEIRELVSKK